MASKFVEFGSDPEEGMVLVGFSCDAVLEGRELKQELMDLMSKDVELGTRKAVELFKKVSLASFDESLKVVRKLRKDFIKFGRTKTLTQKTYRYTINRAFWMFEEDIPQNDPRYFKLKVIDCKDIDLSKYQGTDKKFDAKEFVKDFVPEDRPKISKKESLSVKEIVPEDQGPRPNE